MSDCDDYTNETVEVKTCDLIGAALDWAVAKCEEPSGRDNAAIWLRDYLIGFSTRYSTNWSQGGPIIERERIHIEEANNLWGAVHSYEYYLYGPTPLIAAMRCYVASKLGDAVEIPKELTKELTK